MLAATAILIIAMTACQHRKTVKLEIRQDAFDETFVRKQSHDLEKQTYLVDITKRSETHEILLYFGMISGSHAAMLHWPDCRYCKKKNTKLQMQTPKPVPYKSNNSRTSSFLRN